MIRRWKKVLIAVLFMAGLLTLRVGKITLSPDFPLAASRMEYHLQLLSERGDILDRNGEKLINETEEFLYLLLPRDSSAESLLASGIPFSYDDLMSAYASFRPAIARSKILFPKTPDVTVYPSFIRYQKDQIAAQLIGYLDETGHGISGLEYYLNDLLYQGGNQIALSYQANALGGLRMDQTPIIEQTLGKSSVTLTLDKNMQKKAEELLKEAGVTGCVVVSDCKTGELLALASAPTFSPLFLSEALASEDGPFQQRYFQAYDAGSIFKLVTAAAALEMGYNEEETGYCGSYYESNGQRIACSNRYGHGTITMEEAFASSCNPYFCALAEKVGAKKLLSMAQACSLGQYSELLPGFSAAAGNLPTESQLQNATSLAMLGFGQGNLQVTPLQMATLVGAVANGGIRKMPILIDSYRDKDGRITENIPTEGIRIFSEETAKKLQKMMVLAVNEGSGQLAGSSLFASGGKTGTAETGWVTDKGETMVHGWFVGFFPADNPTYAIVVFCEDGKSGAEIAAPIFKELSEWIFLREQK